MPFALSSQKEKSCTFVRKAALPEQKTILFCPLNWGLGHASRSVPLLRVLQHLGYNILIAADQAPLAFLRNQFPASEWIRFKGFEPGYTKGKKQFFKLLLQIPIAFWYYYCDKIFIAKLVKSRKIDLILSDNRFGAWHKKVPSVIITHQLNLKLPPGIRLLNSIANMLNHKLIKNFDQCWIPDHPPVKNLSGELSLIPVNFIPACHLGILSRFNLNETNKVAKDIDLLVILSGPEPQRSLLEHKLTKLLADTDRSCVILRGLPQNHNKEQVINKIRMLNHAPDEEFLQLISRSKKLVCRGGYSTIMDLLSLKVNALLIPTPGQSEQEYLAEYLAKKNWFQVVSQDQISLSDLFAATSQSQSEIPDYNPENLESILRNQLKLLGIS
ncbi:MAG: glycosyltransferase family protein [Bacteroidales bacterium]|nr:glycosyltransferase family protein [Bacteroidales bacterium]